MYTNAGIFQTMSVAAIGRSAVVTQQYLTEVMAGNIELSRAEFVELSKFEEDIMAHIIHLAELYGRTNVCTDSMTFP